MTFSTFVLNESHSFFSWFLTVRTYENWKVNWKKSKRKSSPPIFVFIVYLKGFDTNSRLCYIFTISWSIFKSKDSLERGLRA